MFLQIIGDAIRVVDFNQFSGHYRQPPFRAAINARNYIPAGQAGLANRLALLFKLEHLIGPPCGLSLIAIAQNNDQQL